MSLLLGAALTFVWAWAFIMAGKKDKHYAASLTGQSLLDTQNNRKIVIKPFYFLLDRSGVWDRIQTLLAGLHGKLLILGGTSWTIESTRQFVAFSVGIGYLAIVASCWLSWLSGENTLLLVGGLLGLGIPAARWRDAGKKVERRKQEILLMLPEVLSKLMLLLGAGETVQRALLRCTLRKDGKQSSVLLEELRRANEGIRNGESFAAAMEAFSRRCAVQEVSLFTTTLLLNYRRGGDKLSLSLKELSYTLWDKRKAVARSMGEEASSKLVFPLVGIFLILMVLVASPAIMLMGG
ncbi:type II secretion system F family protein [Paenibacillus sepulcri]|uniref:Type II secretion system F family protein n=1 Tax=Paenibacillus sepulcri TaxID=359917 RepID=A0ABS7BZ43_9BACL|nr:type II secretion system F family protein [Paenibacillus sepulcri]